MGGGIPIGAFMAKESCAVFKPGDHGGTYGGNPLMCATSLAVMQYVIEHDIPGKSQQAGLYFIDGLNKLKSKYSSITEVRGRGLLIAVEFNKDLAGAIKLSCIENGMTINDVKPNALRIMPPLTISNKEIDEALTILDKVFSEIKV
jgi:acetylornithine/succinyldiaminopimelate/putrescine aminotransferase